MCWKSWWNISYYPLVTFCEYRRCGCKSYKGSFITILRKFVVIGRYTVAIVGLQYYRTNSHSFLENVRQQLDWKIENSILDLSKKEKNVWIVQVTCKIRVDKRTRQIFMETLGKSQTRISVFIRISWLIFSLNTYCFPYRSNIYSKKDKFEPILRNRTHFCVL